MKLLNMELLKSVSDIKQVLKYFANRLITCIGVMKSFAAKALVERKDKGIISHIANVPWFAFENICLHPEGGKSLLRSTDKWNKYLCSSKD